MPSYTKPEFLRLIEEVERQGGTYTDVSHDVIVHDDLFQTEDAPLIVQNCGEAALFDVPYEPMGHDGTLDVVRLCAVDDLMGLMPRFAAANATGGLR
jgi:hypothetical protein